MDIVPSIWLSSLAGAAFFYAGGRIWPRGRALADAEARSAALEEGALADRAAAARAEQQAEGELSALRAEAARLAAETKGLGDERARLSEERARLFEERQRLAEETSRLGAQAAHAAGELADLRARGAAEIGQARSLAGAAEARAADATRRAASLAQDLERRKGELAAAGARLKDLGDRLAAAEARAAEVDRLREENAGLRQAVASLEHARAAAAPDLAELQRRSTELAMRTRVLEHRAGELARKDEEIAELARRVEELTLRAEDADALRRRVKDLEAQGFARAPQESSPDLPPSERWGEGEGLETSLEAALAEIVEREGGCRTAVLSDARGLLIAGAGGDCRDEVAAAAALATTAADRLRELLPVGPAASMAVLDEGRVVFRTRWLRYGDEIFLLSTLGVRTRPLDPGAETLRAKLAAFLGG